MGATKPRAAHWAGPIVPFEIDPNLDHPDRVLQAIRDHWEEQTNLRFVRRTGQGHFVLFRHGQECNSPSTEQSGMHPVTLKPDCDVPTIIHEIGHASGMIHEHQRSDRDTFVTVQPDNIIPDRKGNFERLEDSINLTDYDPPSIMHYGMNTFSANGMPTLLPVDPSVVLNGSTTFTPLDLDAISQRYPHVGIVRRSDSGVEAAGRVSEIAVAHGSTASDVVTAVRTEGGTLRLIRWTINEFGGVTRANADSGDQAGRATSIAIARGQLFVTACRQDDGRLLLISWSTSGDQISREGDSGDAAGSASLIRILALTSTLFVTACRDDGGNLLLISWQLDGGSVQRLADSETQAGAVSEISLVQVRQVGSDHRVATTVRDGGGRVLTIVWNVATDGKISRLGDSGTQMGEGNLIESAIHPSTGLLAVSCRTAAGTLTVITLSVSSNGRVVRRQGDSGEQAGGIENNALMARPTGVLSAVKAASGNLLLIGWGIDAEGQVARLGDSADQAGGIGLVRLGNDTGRDDAPVLTSVQTEAGDLMLITWDDQPAHGELS
jgi:hypothetical protein